MSRIRGRLSSALLATGLMSYAVTSARGQERDSAASRLRDAPLSGSARVNLLAAYRPVSHAWAASVAATFAPFIDERWQLGIEPALYVEKDPVEHLYTGGLSVLANYLFLHGNVSRPYVGVYLSEIGSTGSPATTVLGVQAGWLRFVTPSIAFRTELAYRRSSFGFDNSLTELTVSLDPYLFGRAGQRLTALPGLGAVDVTGIAQFVLHPDRTFLLQGTVAPLLAQWFQPGLSITYAASGSNPIAEAFGRGYLPIATRFAPFADLFGTANQNTNSHGARAGVRSYLARGVALDVDWEWRNFDRYNFFQAREQHTLRASLITQFNAR